MAFDYVLRKGFSTTGIEELDLVLLGGYKIPSFNGFYYLNKDLIDAFSKPFFIEGWNNIYISTERPGIEVLNKFNPSKVIDLYSIPAGISTEKKSGVLYLEGVVALNDISFELNKILQSSENPPRIVIDNLTTFLLYNPLDSLMKFLNVIKGRTTERGGIGLVWLDQSIGKEKVEVIERVFDEVFVEGGKDGKRIINTDRYPFGIEFEIIEENVWVP